jgi:hypothetical protein
MRLSSLAMPNRRAARTLIPGTSDPHPARDKHQMALDDDRHRPSNSMRPAIGRDHLHSLLLTLHSLLLTLHSLLLALHSLVLVLHSLLLALHSLLLSCIHLWPPCVHFCSTSTRFPWGAPLSRRMGSVSCGVSRRPRLSCHGRWERRRPTFADVVRNARSTSLGADGSACSGREWMGVDGAWWLSRSSKPFAT